MQGAAGDGDRADPSGGMGQPGSSCSAEDEGGGAEAVVINSNNLLSPSP